MLFDLWVEDGLIFLLGSLSLAIKSIQTYFLKNNFYSNNSSISDKTNFILLSKALLWNAFGSDIFPWCLNWSSTTMLRWETLLYSVVLKVLPWKLGLKIWAYCSILFLFAFILHITQMPIAPMIITIPTVPQMTATIMTVSFESELELELELSDVDLGLV